MKASVTLLVHTLVVMRSQTPERAKLAKASLLGRLCAGACAKIPRTFAQSVDLFNLPVLTSIVPVGVCVH